jgi:hypothetical protein
MGIYSPRRSRAMAHGYLPMGKIDGQLSCSAEQSALLRRTEWIPARNELDDDNLMHPCGEREREREREHANAMRDWEVDVFETTVDQWSTAACLVPSASERQMHPHCLNKRSMAH